MQKRLTPAQQRLVAANTGLVHAVIRRLRIGGVGRDDGISEGMLALCEAARTWRPGRSQFSTWATLRVGWHLRTWMSRVNRVAAADVELTHRLRGREHSWTEADECAPDGDWVDSLVQRVMGGCPDATRDVVRLALRGATPAEMRERTGLSRARVQALRTEAREALEPLRAIMQDDL